MIPKRTRLTLLGLVAVSWSLGGCTGDDGDDGAPGPTVLNASQMSAEALADLDVVSEVTRVSIASPPVVTFSLETDGGVPITGIVPFWEDSNRFVRFTISKLVPGGPGQMGGNPEPDSWVTYTRDATTNEPDYDTGASLVDNNNGTYTFRFNTDIRTVAGVPYEPSLTHRVAGQIGSGSVALEAQNLFYDFVPTGAAVSRMRNIATMESCNECHSDLVFHGRRFEVEYCVSCHNPDLASGEGNFGYMIHRIHAAGDFAILDGGISYAEVTYPQDVTNCRKCHDGMDADTPQGDNWKNLPNIAACFACHEEADHPGGQAPPDGSCALCHAPQGDDLAIEEVHTTPNATPNNPNLLAGQRNIEYELLSAAVDGVTNDVTIELRVLSDGVPLDVANLPVDLATPGRYPGLLLAWALPQDGIDEPMDYNNLGQRAAQPLSLALDGFFGGGTTGTHSYDMGSGVNTFVVTDGPSQFPLMSTLRAVGLQGYFQQEIMGETVSLHTPSMVVEVTGDDARRQVIDSAKCANCHEWFEGHGGNRTLNIEICTLCHVPNLSSSGRTVVDETLRDLDDDILAAVMEGSLDPSVDPDDALTYPEDAQGLKDLIHGIHSSGDRTRSFQHVRGPGRQGYYDWSHVTFPRGASTAECSLCHEDGTYTLPLPADVLATTVRTTGQIDGQDPTKPDAEAAFVNVPNATDWVNTPISSSCAMCHTSDQALAHMEQNGGLVSLPAAMWWTNRSDAFPALETCTICHGSGKTADIEVVHDR